MTAEIANFPAQAYIYSIGAVDGPQKIGFARNVRHRISNLQSASHVTFSVNVSVPVEQHEVRDVEKCCHYLLRDDFIRGEWFNVSPEEAAATIHRAVEMVRAGWTLPLPKADGASQYRMTPADLQSWQDRLFGPGYGSQIKAAEALKVPVQTYRNWLSGRRSISDQTAHLCRYIERFGPLD